MPPLTTEHIIRNLAILSTKIDVLERRESELQALLDSLAHERRGLENERDYLETQRIPFHWIPTELLSHIFIFAIHDNSDSPPFQSRMFVGNFSEPWPPSSHVQHYLEHARGTPIDKKFISRPPDNSVSEMRRRRLRRRDSDPQPYILDDFPPLRSLSVRGMYDHIATVLMCIRRRVTCFASLKSLELVADHAHPAGIHDVLRTDVAGTFINPWKMQYYQNLRSLTLRDVPLSCVVLGQLPKLREITLGLSAPTLSGSFLDLPYLARLLACAPCVEKLSLLGAGPIFTLSLDSSPNVQCCWEDDAAWRAEGLEGIPQVPLEQLREFEWTVVHPDALHRLLEHFPMPQLEVLDVAFVDVNKSNAPVVGPNPIPFRTERPLETRSAIRLPNLKVLRVECTSGDALRTPFLWISLPSLETLSVSNTNLNVRWENPRWKDDDSIKLPVLPRPESMFHDPRMPHLTHLLLSAVALPSEYVSTMLGFMPALERINCDAVLGVNLLVDALSAPRLGGVRACPRLRRIQLWRCEGVEHAPLVRVLRVRNGSASDSPPRSSKPATSPRPIKRLPKGLCAPRAKVSPWLPNDAQEDWRPAKIEQISVEECIPITETEALSLQSWGVNVEWTPPPS
ncbi:hypothetical protein BC834DRAFT_858462 [Gloeopeniophorella convolvens]|nr:hypothetical protein BC834DRAFT_858462 [Gloeopeniophorella convolvens]